MGTRFVVCVSTECLGEFSSDDLTVGRAYEVLAGPDEHNTIRLIDDSGEYYLYPMDCFVPH
ncbi:hypothetical protein BAE29_07125 [Acidithiobacillus caldus]|uniref:Uncharacterized protein n=1 Tax=Acidithiobacillus caldus TaxID=33059 RepID=A0A1E7YN23_9PROT|nr:hypothetical protein BAE27_07410 [Acidithiobacillus caldus]OFC37318.1 hypothetical protein BAE28_07320 [Acidithiobacillus caldus]OFC39598.1 hypothetical protein BAE29_07125 [Acidithiobacillus caldus]